MKRKTFTFLYDKLTQDNMYQILSQSVRFCRLYIKKHFDVFFRFTVYTVGLYYSSPKSQLGWLNPPHSQIQNSQQRRNCTQKLAVIYIHLTCRHYQICCSIAISCGQMSDGSGLQSMADVRVLTAEKPFQNP